MEHRRPLPSPTRVVPAVPEIIDAEPADAATPRGRRLRTPWDIVIHHRWLILGFTTAVVALVATWSFTTTPVYEGTLSLQIDPERPRVVTVGDASLAAQDDIRFNERVFDAYYGTQYERLTSRTLLARVESGLGLQRHPAFADAGDRWPILHTAMDLIWPATPATAAATNARVFPGLERYIDVSPVKRSRIVRITARVPDPGLAAAIPNRIASEYIETSTQERREATDTATKWLQAQLVNLRRRSEDTTGNIQQFVQKNQIVPNADGRLDFVLHQLDQQSTAYTEAENDRIRKETRQRMLDEASDPDALAAAIGSDLVRSLKADLARLEREVARARTVYGPEHPKMQELAADLTNAKARFESEVAKARAAVAGEHRAAVARARELHDRLESRRETAIKQYARQMQLALMRKEADATETVYSDLIKRLKQLELSAQLQAMNIKVIAPAERPLRPVSPNHPRDLILALAGGLAGGLALAFMRELGDKTLRTAREADLVIQVPSVATVPALRGYSRRMLPAVEDLPVRALPGETLRWPKQVAAEAFRSIRTIVLKRNAPSAPRTLLVTSAEPSEGKSFVAVNLAVSLAETGLPVLLVDADFRQPACHHALGLPLPRFGLSTLLERHGTLDSVIVPGGVPNLAFLPSGPRPRDPAALLSSEQIFELLDTVTEQYRWVVIDSPPVLPVSDAAVLAPIVDGVLLVVRAHATPVEAVQVARDRLEFLGAKILGVVLNDVRVTRSRYFYANYA